MSTILIKAVESRYPYTEKYHGLVPEVTRLHPDELHGMDPYED